MSAPGRSTAAPPRYGGAGLRFTDTAREEQLLRGIRAATRMLDDLGTEEQHSLRGGVYRRGPYVNAVRIAMGAVVTRGSAAELEGFTAALTWALAFGDDDVDFKAREIERYADKRETVLGQRASRRPPGRRRVQ